MPYELHVIYVMRIVVTATPYSFFMCMLHDVKTVNDLTEYESSWVSNFLDDGLVWVFALRLKVGPMQRGDNSLLLICGNPTAENIALVALLLAAGSC